MTETREINMHCKDVCTWVAWWQGQTFTHLRYQFFPFLGNIIILLHFYVNICVGVKLTVSQVIVYVPPLFIATFVLTEMIEAPPRTKIHSLKFLTTFLQERTCSLILFMCKSACLSYKHMYHVHLHHVHFYSNNLLYYLSYTIFINDNKIATCIYPKLKKS